MTAVAPVDCAISTITSYELHTGVEKCANPAKERVKVDALIQTFRELPWDAIAAMEAAWVRAHLESLGQPIGPYDTLLGGQALALALIVVTANVKEFSRVPGLTVETGRYDPNGHWGLRMITIGSISREDAAKMFPFLGLKVSGRRRAIKEFTHRDPEFVFWIHPDGRLHDAHRSHRDNVPRGNEHILADEPDYGGFLRGRVASSGEHQLIVVYCPEDALAASGPHVDQFLRGISQLPIPLRDDALVVSDNADIYGTLADLFQRAAGSD